MRLFFHLLSSKRFFLLCSIAFFFNELILRNYWLLYIKGELSWQRKSTSCHWTRSQRFCEKLQSTEDNCAYGVIHERLLWIEGSESILKYSVFEAPSKFLFECQVVISFKTKNFHFFSKSETKASRKITMESGRTRKMYFRIGIHL